jgi:hypothetical protein
VGEAKVAVVQVRRAVAEAVAMAERVDAADVGIAMLESSRLYYPMSLPKMVNRFHPNQPKGYSNCIRTDMDFCEAPKITTIASVPIRLSLGR